MDPIAVLKTLWNYKILVIPILVITLVAGAYVFKFGPRSYEVSMSYAIVNPSTPTERQIEKNPRLDAVNKDNPYLRSSDPSLITDVVVTLLNSSTTSERIESANLGPDYNVGQGVNSNGFVIDITGISDSPGNALSTTLLLGKILEEDLHKIQKVNDADDSYLYTALVVAPPDTATEQFSSRLRALILVAIGGGVLVIGAVSFGRSFSESRNRRRNRESSHDSEEAEGQEAVRISAADSTERMRIDSTQPQLTEISHNSTENLAATSSISPKQDIEVSSFRQ